MMVWRGWSPHLASVSSHNMRNGATAQIRKAHIHGVCHASSKDRENQIMCRPVYKLNKRSLHESCIKEFNDKLNAESIEFVCCNAPQFIDTKRWEHIGLLKANHSAKALQAR